MSALWLTAAKQVVAGFVSLLLATGAAITLAPVAANADSAPLNPADPGTPVTVTADALPTVQINGVAWSQVVVGNTVYVAGKFSTARPAGAAPGTQEVTRNNLLAYDVRTGELITSFAPSLNAQAMVVTVSSDGSRIYVGGDFSAVDGQPRARVAAFSTATGALVPDFRPSMFGQVRAIAATTSTVYIGGNFTAIGSAARNGLAALSAADGSLLPWAPQPGVGSTSGNRVPNNPALNASTSDDIMSLLLTSGDTQVVAAGRFDTLNGVKSTGVGALDAVTGATRPFAIGKLLTNQGVNSAVYSLTTDGTRVFGTAYDYYGPGNLEGSFSVTADGGNILAINDCRGDSYSNFATGGALYLAGHPHDCGNIGGFSEQNPRINKFGIAVSVAPVGTVGSRTLTNSNFRGAPAPALQNWFPTMSPGTYTGQAQAGWSVAGNDQYVVYGGEFPYVNGVGQQGLVRYAMSSIAPNKVGPAQNADLTPTVSAVAPGLTRLSWTATSDQDNANLTYRVYRDGDTTTPIGQVTQASTWWNRPTLRFTDGGLTGGDHRYLVTATDPAGNVTSSAWTTVTVAAGGSGLRAYETTVRADGASGYWTLGESSRSTAYDHAGSTDLGVGNGVTVSRPGAISGDTDTAYRFGGTSSGIVYSQNATPAPNTFTVEAWFQTTDRTGGKIVGFGNSRTSQSNTYDRHVYMDAQGRVIFGVNSSLKRTVSSATGLNDGKWHHVAASLSPAGMALYVDGKLVGSRADTTTGSSYNGYLRIGGDRSWSGDSWFNGQIDDVALYTAALPADRVANHFSLGSTGKPLNLAPDARFSSAATYLDATFDATSSVDTDGSVASYAWTFGDGGTATGATPTHPYAAAGTYPVTLTVTDDDGATDTATAQVTVLAPPPNVTPTAVLAATSDGLAVSVNSTGSGDADGHIVTYTWDFGDGSSESGATATHVYAADGTYTVRLTVTDERGGTGTAEQQLSVFAPVIVAADAFNRTVTGGLGTADVGGAWTAAYNAVRQSVAPGTGTFTMVPGAQVGSFLNGVAENRADLVTTLSLAQAPTGNGLNVLFTGRRVAVNQEYRLRLRFQANGTVYAGFTKLAGTGTDVLVGSEVTLPGTYTAGTALRVRLVVTSGADGTTQLSARVSPATASEPTAWTLTATDSTASLQAPGGVGVNAYMAGNAVGTLAVNLSGLEVRRVR
ncbi:PKD domain-containing protein [Blastococcus sp. CT_GayMR16]|uniref:PKD domain-containing protein n=1 Tax=Blastococcus sp. CT_GayMR16 TaxID=2559607 RepID=UPI001073BC19|nr:PKD domain-containing protein [Blastococcus sp. CT_GayMR16]TFV90712.1 PKD domain-containing protein [Blastococcus sp. CT_GayMR16]